MPLVDFVRTKRAYDIMTPFWPTHREVSDESQGKRPAVLAGHRR